MNRNKGEKENNNFQRSSSEKPDSHNTLLKKHLFDPNSISLSLFNDSESEGASDHGEDSSDNWESEYDSDLGKEEDFNEADINEMISSKPKWVNKNEYIKYLNSVGTPMIEVPENNSNESEKNCESKSKILLYEPILGQRSKKGKK